MHNTYNLLSEWDIQFFNTWKHLAHPAYFSSPSPMVPCRAKWADGTQAETVKEIGVHNIYTSFPISILRKQAFKSPIKEILAIWQMRSNKISDLGQIWSQWDIGDGTIGEAYGKQLAKVNDKGVNQVDNLLHLLETDRYSRRMVAQMWNHEESHLMSLTPCAYQIQLIVKPTYQGDILHMILNQRSNDTIVAGSWNAMQYWILLEMFARHSNMKVGKLHHIIGDAHVYDRHIEIAETLIEAYLKGSFRKPSPVLSIDYNIKHFYDFTVDDFTLSDYYPVHDVKNIEVAV